MKRLIVVAIFFLILFFSSASIAFADPPGISWGCYSMGGVAYKNWQDWKFSSSVSFEGTVPLFLGCHNRNDSLAVRSVSFDGTVYLVPFNDNGTGRFFVRVLGDNSFNVVIYQDGIPIYPVRSVSYFCGNLITTWYVDLSNFSGLVEVKADNIDSVLFQIAGDFDSYVPISDPVSCVSCETQLPIISSLLGTSVAQQNLILNNQSVILTAMPASTDKVKVYTGTLNSGSVYTVPITATAGDIFSGTVLIAIFCLGIFYIRQRLAGGGRSRLA